MIYIQQGQLYELRDKSKLNLRRKFHSEDPRSWASGGIRMQEYISCQEFYPFLVIECIENIQLWSNAPYVHIVKTLTKSGLTHYEICSSENEFFVLFAAIK